MTITKMTPAACKKIRSQLNQELEDIGKRLGLTISAGNGSYDDTSVTFKVECLIEGVDKAKENFEAECYLFHLPESAYQAEFQYHGKTWILEGVKPRRPKYPIIASKKGQKGNFKLKREAIASLVNIPKAEINPFVAVTKA